jgi:hypothetical protein
MQILCPPQLTCAREVGVIGKMPICFRNGIGREGREFAVSKLGDDREAKLGFLCSSVTAR